MVLNCEACAQKCCKEFDIRAHGCLLVFVHRARRLLMIRRSCDPHVPCPGINILAGATLGGGTRINWSASFATPDHVRKEWAEQHGLEVFASEEYDHALAAVTERLGVTTGNWLMLTSR